MSLTKCSSCDPKLLYNKAAVSVCMAKSSKKMQQMLDILKDRLLQLSICFGIRQHYLLFACLFFPARCEHQLHIATVLPEFPGPGHTWTCMSSHRASVAFDLSTLSSDLTCLAAVEHSLERYDKVIRLVLSCHATRASHTSYVCVNCLTMLTVIKT